MIRKQQLTILVVLAFVMTMLPLWTVPAAIDTGDTLPANNLTHRTYVIKNTKGYTKSYIDLISKDYGNQSFNLVTNNDGKDLYLYTLSHSTTKYQEEQFGKWLVSFYGAEVENEK